MIDTASSNITDVSIQDQEEKCYITNPLSLDGVAANMLQYMIPEVKSDAQDEGTNKYILSEEMRDLKNYMNTLRKVKKYIDFYKNLSAADIYDFMNSDAYKILTEGV